MSETRIQSDTEQAGSGLRSPTSEPAAGHTPGPWEYGAGDDYYIRADAYPKTFPHHFKTDDLGDYLAYVGNRASDFGEANARLIAAAPDLLVALQNMLGAYDTPFSRRRQPLTDFTREVLETARAAVKRALAGGKTTEAPVDARGGEANSVTK